jgi:spore germination protein YaaH
MRRFLLFVCIAAMVGKCVHAAPVGLFYMNRSPEALRSFLAHSSQIGILVPTWYDVDENGLVTGAPDPTVLQRAKEEKLPVMPIIAVFDKKAFHVLSSSAAAQARMNEAMVRECKQHGYTGFQIDFEDIDYIDRDGLTALVKATAEALHGAGLQLTIATVPNAPGHPGQGGYSKWMWTDWRGVYDLEALVKYVDLVCLMTYDQHSRWTSPGPVAGWDWTVENLDYALKVVPREKLSLGIPLYGYHWFTGTPIKDSTGKEKGNPTAESISAPNALQLAETYKGVVQWDAADHSSYAYFYRDQLREWLFFTDVRTFKERYELMQKQGLQGFCSWVLGQEDPAIWTLLPSRR